MSDRDKRREAKSLSRGGRRCRPRVFLAPELLEGRALLSIAGGPDLTFGSGGFSSIPSGAISYNSMYLERASAVQPNGDLVVVGNYTTPSTNSSSIASGFLVTRYTPNGSYDDDFDVAAIAYDAVLNTAGQANDGPWPTYSGATGVAVLPDGNIVVVGNASGTGTPLAPMSAQVVMLNPDGSLDTSFGHAGVVQLGTEGAGDGLLDYASTVAILPSGQIAVGGSISPSQGHDTPAVEVLNANGSVATTFGTNGLAAVPVPGNALSFAPIAPYTVRGGQFDELEETSAGPINIVAQPNGEVVIDANAILNSSTLSAEVVSTRLTASGKLDTTYGTGGQVAITPNSVFPKSTLLSGTALAIQPNGDLVIGGGIFVPNSISRMVAIRLTPTGAFDTTFGVGGVNILPLATANPADIGAIAIQSNGQIVVADQVSDDFVRLNANGSLDNSFGTAGESVIYSGIPILQNGTPPASMAVGGSVSLEFSSVGKILAVGTQGGTQGVFQLLSIGAGDDFNGDGISDEAFYNTTTGTFTDLSYGGTGLNINFGPAGVGQTLPAPGAYGGEGVDEIAIYMPSAGAFAILSIPTGQVLTVPYGVPGAGNSLPAPGDYDKSGATELAIYDPVSGVYVYRSGTTGLSTYTFIGTPNSGAVPVPADYFGTGQDDVAVFEPGTSTFLIQDPLNGQIISIPVGVSGGGTPIPVPGDYDGSGHADVAVYEPSKAEVIYQSTSGGAAVTIPFGISGVGQTLPEPGNYDGSGKTDVAAYFPTTGGFAYRPANGGSDVVVQVGAANKAVIPFVTGAGTVGGGTVSAESITVPGSAEIPLTPDVLDTLTGTMAKKKTANG